MRLSSLALALVLAALPVAARSQTTAAPGSPVMTVGGDGVVTRSPDRARVGVDIVTNDDAATRSGGRNTAIYNAFVARLATIGVAASDVGTTSYNVAFVPYPPKDLPAAERQPRYGYITTRSLSVLVTPIDNAGKVVDAATAVGVTQIGDVTFELKDRHGAYLAALAAAMNDAKSTAAALAEAGNFHVLRIRRIDAGAESPGPIPLMRRAPTAMAAEAPTTIAPNGPIEVTAHLTVTYDIGTR